MRLKRLELSGFKSFAKQTILEFPHPISAVVGPNGSGKSNVADALRWVLGEQSIKSLRGKRGEDLIFSGTPSAPRLSKAAVVLFFDNSKRAAPAGRASPTSGREFPLEFEEVAVGRRVYRDGVNDYLLNGSQVRLKDIIELLSKVGFGSSQHHIIGQGEADRILYASPSERREVIEDALGLKIFQLKRAEAERKLGHTEENMKQVSSIQKEIQPHLKFLKSQAEKFEVASKLRAELKEFLGEYLSRREATLKKRAGELSEKRRPSLSLLKTVERELDELKNKIEKIAAKEKALPSASGLGVRLQEARERRIAAERELGRLEGIISLAEKEEKSGGEAFIPEKEIRELLDKVSALVGQIEKESMLEAMRRLAGEVKKAIGDFISKLRGGEGAQRDFEEYRQRLEFLKTELEKIRKEERDFSRAVEEEAEKARRETEESRQEERRVYHLELEAAKLKDVLRSFEVEEEKIRLAEGELGRELEEARPYLGGEYLKKGEVFSSEEEAQALRKKAERTKIRLEEAGGIDPAVLKEYEEVSKRDEFFGKELGDLAASAGSLRQAMKELEKKLEHDFKDGVLKINSEFQKFFATMFGGGKASLKVITRTLRKRRKEEGENGEEEAGEEEGIDISVDLPRKRIRSLDMLSGGERALTSIALLFAMSSVHPPPFLVLDETDAALDEANSERYAKMLEDLSKTTQLIVITHNRTTMKCVGVLYGVTMGSDGISKLLSLKFEEAGALVS